MLFRFLVVLFAGALIMGAVDLIETVGTRIAKWWLARHPVKDNHEGNDWY